MSKTELLCELERRLAAMERRLLQAIKEPQNIKIEQLTEQLKQGNESLDKAVKSNNQTQ